MLSPNPWRVFYALSLVACMYYAYEIRDHAVNLAGAVWIWPLNLVSLSGVGYFGLYIACVGIFALAVLIPRFVAVRAAAAVAWMVLLALVHPFDYVGHSYYVWSFVAVLLIWPNGAQAMTASRAYCLSTYCAAGLWKVRSFAAALMDGEPFSVIGKILSSQTAAVWAEARGTPFAFCTVLLQSPTLSGALWVANVVFQISTAAMIFHPRFNPVWGLLLMGFHFSTSILLGISYTGQILLLTFLFLLYPGERK